MQVWAHLVGVVLHDLNQFARNFGGFDAGQPHAKRSVELTYFTDQRRQPHPVSFRFALIKINAVMAKVNPRQDYLSVAVVDQPPYFIDDLVLRAAEHVGPHGGNDAVAAFEQTAVLDFDVGPVSAIEPRDAVGNITDPKSPQQIRQLSLIGDHFTDAGKRGDRFRFACRITSHHNDTRVRILAVHLADDLTTFGVAFAGDRAGVDHA